MIRPDGSSLKELTFSRGFDGDPAWNDDGTKIAFETSRNGKLDLYSINSDGTGETRLTTSGGGRRRSGLVARRHPHRVHE